MKHYNRAMWLLYVENKLSPKERDAMEEHLQVCDKCLSSYLSILLPQDEEQSEKLLSLDFNEKLMGKLPERKQVYKEKSISIINSLQYYAVAAAITVVLMTGGWFDLFAHRVPELLANEINRIPRIEEKISFGFSERLMNELFDKKYIMNEIKEVK